MRVFLAGATGAVGRRLVPLLVDSGHQVVTTTRTESKLDSLARLGAEPVVARRPRRRARSASAVADGRTGCRHPSDDRTRRRPTCKHFDRTFAATNRLRIEGHRPPARRRPRDRRHGGSSRRASPAGPTSAPVGPVKTEEDPLDPEPPRLSNAQTLAAIRHLERAVLAAPLDGVVLRYGLLYGPGACGRAWSSMIRKRASCPSWATAARRLVDDAHRRRRRRRPSPPSNAAAASTTSWTTTRPASRELLADLAEARSVRNRPGGCRCGLLGSVAGEVGGVDDDPQARGSSNAKAKRELGWTPRWSSWRDGFAARVCRRLAARR